MMKKYLLLFVLCFFTFPCLGQIYTSVNIGGYWGKWKQSSSYYTVQGHYDNFIIYDSYDHPSEYNFKVVITNYSVPDAKTRRQHWNNKQWYTYYGYIEWKMPDDCEIKDVIDVFPVCPGSVSGKYKKIKRNATIKIAPYKKNPNVYNVWVDGYGIAIQLP